MPFDFLIIGSGLSGLFAGCLAARRGKKALVLARGIGGTHVGPGTIDVSSGGQKSLTALCKSAEHPYGKVGLGALEAALDEFKTICAEAGYPMHGELGANWTLPTAAGSSRQTCLAPETMIAGDLGRSEPVALAHFPGFRDFSAALAAANLGRVIPSGEAAKNLKAKSLRHTEGDTVPVITLPLPQPSTLPHTSGADLARRFDRPHFRDQLIALWKPLLKDAPKRIGLPAVMGLEQPLTAKQHLDSALGIELFEIPILPPSVPGARLFNILRDDFQNHGGQLILGPMATGRIAGARAVVSADANGRVKDYTANTIGIATGGFLNGGLIGEFDGLVREAVFNLDVDSRTGLLPRTPRQSWTAETFLGAHAFLKFGLRVNKNLQPLNADGEPAAENLRAIGGLLAGADRLSEGSREGIGLATAYQAVELIQ